MLRNRSVSGLPLMEVEVLGTVFDLRCYEHLDYAELVLVSGSVKQPT